MTSRSIWLTGCYWLCFANATTQTWCKQLSCGTAKVELIVQNGAIRQGGSPGFADRNVSEGLTFTCGLASAMVSVMAGTMSGRQADTATGARLVSWSSRARQPSLDCQFSLGAMPFRMMGSTTPRMAWGEMTAPRAWPAFSAAVLTLGVCTTAYQSAH